jgi:hypothetical protein
MMRSFLAVLTVASALLFPPGLEAQGPNRTIGQELTPGEGASTGADPQIRGGEVSRFSVGGFLGYQDGPSFQVFGLAREFAQGFPLQARLRLARTAVEPGSAPDARRIFINDATNGTPKESGRTWDLGLDGLYPLGPRRNLFGGVRYTRFTANFKYVGGNEDFDVTSSHWGLAAGMEAEFPMGPRMSLLISGGGEYFFSSRLTGHDTSYSPDGDHVNPRKDYTYSDADDAVDQPVLRPVLLLGFSYQLRR